MLELIEWLLFNDDLSKAGRMLQTEIKQFGDPLHLAANTVLELILYGRKLEDARLKDRAADYYFRAAMVCVCEDVFPQFRTVLFEKWNTLKESKLGKRF